MNGESYFRDLKSLLMIRMNEMFPCLACYGQKLKFVVWKSRQRQTQARERKRQRRNG